MISQTSTVNCPWPNVRYHTVAAALVFSVCCRPLAMLYNILFHGIYNIYGYIPSRRIRKVYRKSLYNNVRVHFLKFISVLSKIYRYLYLHALHKFINLYFIMQYLFRVHFLLDNFRGTICI